MTPNDHIEAIARWANKTHLPHQLLNQHMAMTRTDVAKEAGWTDEQIAVSKGITPRQEYHQRRGYQSRKSDQRVQRFLGDGRDPLDQILALTRPGQPVSRSAIMQALPGFNGRQIDVIIARGVKSGVLRASGTILDSADRMQQVEATGKQLVYAAAETPDERAARSMRATQVARDCREDDVYSTTRRSLTSEGVRRVLRFLDPTTGEAIMCKKLEGREGTPNFGILLAFTQASPFDKYLRDPLWRAIMEHDDPENCVRRTTAHMDKKAMAAFAKKDAPEIWQQIEAVLDEAAALGDGHRREFVLTFAFTPLASGKGERP